MSEPVHLSAEEYEKISTALKDEHFRKLLMEYVEELNDPDNRKKREDELAALERERGVDVTFIYPESGYVIKSKTTNNKVSYKVFINICGNKYIGKPQCTRIFGPQAGHNWDIPYVMAPPREDIDKAGSKCFVYDVVYNPDTLYMATKNAQFKKLIEDTACDAIEEKFEIKLDRNNLKYPKLKFKGRQVATVIKDRRNAENNCSLSDYVASKLDNIADENSTEMNGGGEVSIVPRYTIKYRNYVDLSEFCYNPELHKDIKPKLLIIEIELPLLSTSLELDLEVDKKFLALKSKNIGAHYKLDLDLPYPVNDDKGNAKFDKDARKLIVTLPVSEENISIPTPSTIGSNGVAEIPSEVNSTQNGEVLLLDPGTEIEHSPSESKTQIDSSKSHEHYCPCKIDCNIEKDFGYSFPPYNFHQTDEKVVFILKVTNVDHTSLKSYFCQCRTSCQLVFCTLGSGYVPFYYSFCLRFRYPISSEDCIFDANDYNAVFCISKEKPGIWWDHFLVGVDEQHLSEITFEGENTCLSALQELKDEFIEFQNEKVPLSQSQIKILEAVEEKVEFEIELSDNSKKVELENKTETTKENLVNLEKIVEGKEQESTHHKKKALSIVLPEKHQDIPRSRTFSESSEDQASPYHWKRGILKYPAKWRSYSESSDDVNWSSQEGPSPDAEAVGSSYSSSDAQGNRLKKSVTFSEHVHKNVFRSNSSILGQRKKNQRKTRNKKKTKKGDSGSSSDVVESGSEGHASGDGSEYSSSGECDAHPESEEKSISGHKTTDKKDEPSSTNSQIGANPDSPSKDDLKEGPSSVDKQDLATNMDNLHISSKKKGTSKVPCHSKSKQDSEDACKNKRRKKKCKPKTDVPPMKEDESSEIGCDKTANPYVPRSMLSWDDDDDDNTVQKENDDLELSNDLIFKLD